MATTTQLRRRFGIAAFACASVGFLACGEGALREASTEFDDPTPESHDDMVVSPDTGQALTAVSGRVVTVFLNRNGGTYTAGGDDALHNVSSVVSSRGRASVGIPAYRGNNDQWNWVKYCVGLVYAPYGVSVTDIAPAVPHVEIVVGGNPGLMGLPTSSGGIASMTCEGQEQGVGYVFTEGFENNLEWTCSAIAHEAGHVFGLDHEFLCKDPMTYVYGCGLKTFQDVNSACGESGPRACACGRPSQNSHQLLRQRLGDRLTPRDASLAPDGSRYGLLGSGEIRSFSGKPALHGVSWNWDAARRMALRPDAASGYLMDAFGGVHSVGGAAAVTGGAYWPNWDIARDIVLQASSAGYTLDGFGGVHPFGNAPAPRGFAYWSGWDIARAMVMLPNKTGGYVLDGFGGIHPFAVGSNPMPPKASVSAFWSGWDIARDLVLNGTGTGGYVLDGFGGLHPFSLGGAARPREVTGSCYTPGQDVARGVAMVGSKVSVITPFGMCDAR